MSGGGQVEMGRRDTEGSSEFVLIRERRDVLSQMDLGALPGAKRQAT